MTESEIDKVMVLRALAASILTLFFVIAPIEGLAYGTTSVLTLGNLTLASPLDLILASLSARTMPVNLIIPGLVGVSIIVFFGRFFCGWICPVGILLEYSHIITARRWRKGAGGLWINWGKYSILLAVLAAAVLFGLTIPHLFSPPGVLYRIALYSARGGFPAADLFVLALIFTFDLIAIRYDWTWCNSICPLGTFVTSLSVINFVKPKVDKKLCLDFDFNCLNCSNVCPMRIPITSWWAVRNRRFAMMECTKCLKCWSHCPAKAITINVFR